MPLEGAEPVAQPFELHVHVTEPPGEAFQLVRVLRAVEGVGELPDPPLEAQALALELERSRVSVGQRILHLRDEGLPGVGGSARSASTR